MKQREKKRSEYEKQKYPTLYSLTCTYCKQYSLLR